VTFVTWREWLLHRLWLPKLRTQSCLRILPTLWWVITPCSPHHKLVCCVPRSMASVSFEVPVQEIIVEWYSFQLFTCRSLGSDLFILVLVWLLSLLLLWPYSVSPISIACRLQDWGCAVLHEIDFQKRFADWFACLSPLCRLVGSGFNAVCCYLMLRCYVTSSHWPVGCVLQPFALCVGICACGSAVVWMTKCTSRWLWNEKRDFRFGPTRGSTRKFFQPTFDQQVAAHPNTCIC